MVRTRFIGSRQWHKGGAGRSFFMNYLSACVDCVRGAVDVEILERKCKTMFAAPHGAVLRAIKPYAFRVFYADSLAAEMDARVKLARA